MLRGRSWKQRWLYPASSEPPPISDTREWLDQPTEVPIFPQWRPPHYEQSTLEPVPIDNVPFVESSWAMVYRLWSPESVSSVIEVEENIIFDWDERKPDPEFPPWRPPDHPSYFSQDEEKPRPEVDRWVFPEFPPWRPPQQPESFFNTEDVDVTPDRYQDLPRIPPRPKPWLRFPWKPIEEEPPEPVPDFYQPPHIPPMIRPYYMPESIPPFYEPTDYPEICPPPCLRRPPGTCPPPPERPYSGPSAP